jgi:histidine ammonia-lyase
MRPSLGRVLAAPSSGPEPEQWNNALARITAERDAIERMLATDPPPHIYGFTTMLGQLDSHAADRSSQPELLDAHLVGTTRSAPVEFMSLVTRCKIEQLHHGGSGVHPATFRALLTSPDSPSSARGGWLSSYGAGDVVPAAWWIHTALSPAAIADLEQGDLIALLNGNFYSTAYGTASVLAAIDCLAAFLRRAARLCHYPRSSRERGAALRSPELGAYFEAHSVSGSSERAQLPISLRDAEAYLTPIAVAVSAVGDALERRLSAPSANPRFSVLDDKVDVESQSGFLDLTLTLALTNLAQVLHLAIRATQRMIVHATEPIDDGTPPDARLVQPPKAAMAVVERATLLGGQLPTQFTGSDSSGIEDLRDLSLLTGSVVLELVALAGEALAILDTVVPAPADDPEPLHGLLSILGDGTEFDASALSTRFASLRRPFLL